MQRKTEMGEMIFQTHPDSHDALLHGRSTGRQPQSPRLQAQQSEKNPCYSLDSSHRGLHFPQASPVPCPLPVSPDPAAARHTPRGSGRGASASPARALPRPPSGRVGPAPAPPRPGRAPRSAEPPFATPAGTDPRQRRFRGHRRLHRPQAGPPPRPLPAPLTFGGGCGRQAPPRGRRLRWLRALPHPILGQLEMRRVEGVEPGERRDRREHGGLRQTRRAERRGTVQVRHGPHGLGWPRTRPAARGPGASSGLTGRAPSAAPTHLLRWRQRADPLLGRQLGRG